MNNSAQQSQVTAPVDLLFKRNLKITKPRLAVLSCFGDGDHACTYQDIAQIIGKSIDRVSIYRILDIFTQKEIIFKLRDSAGDIFYILNHYNLTNDDLLTLLKCDNCHQVSTLPNPPEGYIEILRKHKIQNPQFLFNGICYKCE